MKRKRGHKKGKSKKRASQSQLPAESPNNDVESVNTEENNSGSEEEEEMEELEEEEINNKVEEEESKAAVVATQVIKEVETPPPPPPPPKVVNIRPDGVFQRPPPTAVYGRVKVKLKTTPKPPLETPVVASSEAQIQSGVAKSSQVVSVIDRKEDGEKVVNGEKVVVDDKVEDSSKKSGGIKIVSSKSSSPPAPAPAPAAASAPAPAPGGLSPKEEEEEEEEEEKTEDREVRLPQRETKYNKEELEASLEVIRKVMKMDAAEPFNVPVDPIGLGIPDYFDVIDTPMDFGTILSNLESGTKYMDSESVYKDVQYIWDNCYKYNNKGDYIVDLMKRVKKNFMKYWMAAGLYTEQNKKIKGEESSPLDEPTTSGHGKKIKKGKGVKRHKDDCLCAICIMKRRRREREAREAQMALEAGNQVASSQIKIPKTGLPEEFKQEEISHAESPVEDTSSYMETSPDGDAEAEMEDGERRSDAVIPQYNNQLKSDDLHDKSDRSGYISEKSVASDKGDELYFHNDARVQDELGSTFKINAQKQPSLQPEGHTAGYLQQRQELLEMEKKRQKLRMLETFRDLENPKLLGLCGTLFPTNVQTIWNGANSLIRCQRSCHRKDIQEAVASFMNPPCKSAPSLK